MDAYIAEIRKLENKFSELEIHHVDLNNNNVDRNNKLQASS